MNNMDPKSSLPDAKPLKIAFTYDSSSDGMARGLPAEQCAEFESDATIEAIAASLRTLGVVEMVGSLKSLTKLLITRPEVDWDVVFNISEGYATPGREAQVPALLEAWNIPFTLSDSTTLALCSDKAKTKVRTQYGRLKILLFIWFVNFARWYWSIMASQPRPLRVSPLERLGLHRGVLR